MSQHIYTYDPTNGLQEVGAGGVIDAALSTSSTNAVQNKVITTEVDKTYKDTDTAETTLADGDYFPFYDTSVAAKRKTLWSNIVSKIKTALSIQNVLTSTDSAKPLSANMGNALGKMVAPIESSSSASRNYVIGAQFVYNGILYKATAAISSGGNINPGSNCTAASSVTAQISDLNSLVIPQGIPSNANLNSYLSDGSFICQTADIAATLSNTPVTDSGFSMQVISVSGLTNQNKMQIIRKGYPDAYVYMRSYFNDGATITWTEWSCFRRSDQIKITSGANLNSYTTDGHYICQTGTIAATLANSPVTDGGFALEVFPISGANNQNKMQVVYRVDNSIYIRSYIANTNTWSEWASFRRADPIKITSNANLNSYTTDGNYICQTGAIAATLSNSPVTDGGFALEVISVSGGSNQNKMQIIHKADANVYMRSLNGSTWSKWSKVTTTVVS